MSDIITAGRDAVDRLILRDSCVIERPDVSYANGTLTEGSPSQLYSGACRVKPVSGADLQVADHQFDTYMYQVTVPYNTDGIETGDTVTVTSSDGDLDGAVLTVAEIPLASTFSILRRILCRRTDTP